MLQKEQAIKRKQLAEDLTAWGVREGLSVEAAFSLSAGRTAVSKGKAGQEQAITRDDLRRHAVTVWWEGKEDPPHGAS